MIAPRAPLWPFDRADRLAALIVRLREAERDTWVRYKVLMLRLRRRPDPDASRHHAELAARARVLCRRRHRLTAALKAAGGSLVVPGCRFGRLVAVAPLGPVAQPCGRKRQTWQCRCDCGRVVPVLAEELTKIHNPAMSCGCRKGGAGRFAAQHSADTVCQIPVSPL